MFGGNSNWRGPIWMPMNALLIRALLHFYSYYGDSFRIECPTGSGKQMNLYEVAHEICRLLRTFLRDERGKRPVSRRRRECSRKIRTGAICSSSTNTSTATTARGSARATRRAGRAWLPVVCNCLPPRSSGQEFLELGTDAGITEPAPSGPGGGAAQSRRR